MKLILASQSPRRFEILKNMGFVFEVKVSQVNEDVSIPEPEPHVNTLSQKKAEAVQKEHPEAIILGADTIVYHDGQILGKPDNPREAAEMLRLLSGSTHEVYTGFTILHPNGSHITDCVVTHVRFRELADWEIERYINTGEALDKAGAYGIQGTAGVFVEKIDGCYYNVVGFPVTRFYQKLSDLAGVDGMKELLDI